MIKIKFDAWTSKEPSVALHALQALRATAGGRSLAERIRTFCQEFPTSAIGGAGTRAHVVSVLLMGENAENYPPYKKRHMTTACGQTGYPLPKKDADEAELYGHGLGFLDRFVQEAAARDLVVRHRLDAQSIVWRTLISGGQKEEDGEEDSPSPPPPAPTLDDLARELHVPVDFLRNIKTLLEEKRQVIFQGPPPVVGTADEYTLTPGSVVGAVEIGGLSVRIAPKIGIGGLLSLACYATGKVELQAREFDFPEQSALPDALARAFGAAARRAFSRGLLHGYRTEEDVLPSVRGRIRFGDQIRSRFGIPLPVEVRYDEFTADILESRLVKAAAHRLARLRLRSLEARSGVAWVAESLGDVSLAVYPPRAVPETRFDRLNEHYRGVVTLARLVLRHGAFEADRGRVRASGFLMDMNRVFQEFVTVALREALGVSDREFGERSVGPLDMEGRVSLKLDLTWRDGSRCMFVGDVKYKRMEAGVPNADLYQLLAYAIALDLPGGLLIYAQGEQEPATHTVRHAGKRLEVAALDLSGALEATLARVGDLAQRVTGLRRVV